MLLPFRLFISGSAECDMYHALAWMLFWSLPSTRTFELYALDVFLANLENTVAEELLVPLRTSLMLLRIEILPSTENFREVATAQDRLSSCALVRPVVIVAQLTMGSMPFRVELQSMDLICSMNNHVEIHQKLVSSQTLIILTR